MTRKLTIANNSNWLAETVDLVIRKTDGTTDVRMLETGHETDIINLNPGDVLEVHPSVDDSKPYGYHGRQHAWYELPQSVPADTVPTGGTSHEEGETVVV